jgi:hypothetical protein
LTALVAGLEQLGYRGPRLERNYSFPDWFARKEIRTLSAAAFAQTPASYETACIGVAQANGSLNKLLSALASVRKLGEVACETKITPVAMMTKLNLPGFPLINIGRKGGFSMPEIRSYREVTGASDSLLPYPDGNTAFDACLWGDKHVNKQGSGAAEDSILWKR